MAWVERYATDEVVSVLDLGGRDINGSPRELFPNAKRYDVVDVQPGPGVDIVGDAATVDPHCLYDLVLCTEVFEHTPRWPLIVENAFRCLDDGGRLVLTMAGPGRPAHSAIDGGHLHPHEYYGNVHPDTLRAVLELVGFRDIEVDRQRKPADVRATAVR